MLQISFSFNEASRAMASVGPRPKMTRLLGTEFEPNAFDQSNSEAEARRSGRRARAALIARSPAQAATRFSKAESDATKLFVAATLSSGPAAIGNTTSQAAANGLSVSLTMAAVRAPEAFAEDADSIRSSLRPDCEIARNSWPSSRKSLRYTEVILGAASATGMPR